jgi:hypothetical protein
MADKFIITHSKENLYLAYSCAKKNNEQTGLYITKDINEAYAFDSYRDAKNFVDFVDFFIWGCPRIMRVSCVTVQVQQRQIVGVVND